MGVIMWSFGIWAAYPDWECGITYYVIEYPIERATTCAVLIVCAAVEAYCGYGVRMQWESYILRL